MEKEITANNCRIPGRVSIIIPCYNCSLTLSTALDSVLTQDYSDIEIIIVDDGSSDCTPEIIKNYQDKNSIIKSIRISNSGPGAARWKGLSIATGEYIQFLDSDDKLLPGAISSLMKEAEADNLDIVELSFLIKNEIGETFRSRRMLPEQLDGLKALSINFNGGYWALWSRFIKAELFDKIEYRGEDLRFGEDLVVSVQLLRNARRVGSSDYVSLVYNVGSTSLSTDPAKSSNRRKDLEKYSTWVRIYLKNEGLLPELESGWRMFRKYILLLMIGEKWYDGIEVNFREISAYMSLDAAEKYSDVPRRVLKILRYFQKSTLLGRYKLKKYIRKGKI